MIDIEIDEIFKNNKIPRFYTGPRSSNQYNLSISSLILLSVLFLIVGISFFAFILSFEKFEDKDGNIYYNPKSKPREWNGDYSLSKKSMDTFIWSFIIGGGIVLIFLIISLAIFGQGKHFINKHSNPPLLI